jgi:hypothetical protein
VHDLFDGKLSHNFWPRMMDKMLSKKADKCLFARIGQKFMKVCKHQKVFITLIFVLGRLNPKTTQKKNVPGDHEQKPYFCTRI